MGACAVSDITLDETKEFLRVIHDDDDALIQSLIEGAEDEAKRFLNRSQLPTLPFEYPASSDASEEVPSSNDPVAPSVKVAIWFLVQRSYEMPDPDKQMKLRVAAETLLMPYRDDLGV